MSTSPVSRHVLDDAKRKTIIALVTGGCSRRAAARYVGCAPSTIIRTARRDPDFALALARAEETAEITLLRSIQAAGKLPGHWRASAWLLERRNPDEFAPRAPNVVTQQQFAEVLASVAETLCHALPEDNYCRVLQKIEEVVEEVRSLHAPIPELKHDHHPGENGAAPFTASEPPDTAPCPLDAIPHDSSQSPSATLPP
jgi:hypothetical protein